jgi:hypothetical protein
MSSRMSRYRNVLLRLFCLGSMACLLAVVAVAQCARPGFNIGKRTFPGVSSIFPIAALDFNGDGRADVALRTSITDSLNKVAILFGDGTGSLSAPTEYSLGPNMSSIIFGDVNSDGRPDMIVNYFDPSSKLWLNNGAGVFAPPINIVTTLGHPKLIVDVNGDGKGDLIDGSESFQVRLGDGAGGFSQGNPLFFPPSGTPGIQGIVPGDFNNDQTIDLAVSYVGGGGGPPQNPGVSQSKLIIYSGDGSGGFVANPVINLTGGYVAITLGGDFNGDGKLDLAGENSLAPIADPKAATVLLNNGTGGFTRTDYPVLSGTAGLYRLQKGDFNGDGKLDLATEIRDFSESYGSGVGSVLYGDGTGGFTRYDQLKTKVKLDVAADFNNDGKTDTLTYLFQSDFSLSSLRTMLGTCSRRNITDVIDYDGDGITDYALWRPSEARWYIRYSSGGLRLQYWGLPTDLPVPGDYDGDDKTDIAVFRPSDGGWYILKSSDNSMLSVQWGASGDKPVQGDYDGDGKVDVGVFRPSDGGWYILKSSDGTLLARAFGLNGDKPVQADFDGDYRTDIAVYRPSNGGWYILRSSDDSFAAAAFGLSTDNPVQGDYDGDGKAEIAVYRPSEGVWYVLHSLDNSVQAFHWGAPPDIPVPGDFEARDGMINVTVRRDNNNSFYTHERQNLGFPVVWGASGDVPVSTPYRIE